MAEVKNINDDMFTQQRATFENITSEISTQFTQKLKEALNQERELFQQRYEADEVSALEDYGVKEIEAGGVLEMLADDQNKDAIDELVL